MAISRISNTNEYFFHFNVNLQSNFLISGLAMPSAQQRRLIAATTELGQCPLHTAVQLRQVYGKLAELSNEAAAAAGGGVHR